MENKVDSGKSLRLIRQTYNLTQKEFGEKIGVSASCVQHWEANYSEPSFDSMRKMKEVYNISYDEIIDGV